MEKKIAKFLFVFLWPSLLVADTYSLKDLEILEDQKDYEEFFLHARDVRPALRSNLWHRMVRHMAVGMLDFKIKRKMMDRKSFKMIDQLANWPTLREDHFFQAKRGSYSLEYFKNCFAQAKSKQSKKVLCKKDVDKFWFSSLKIPDLGYQLTKLVSSHWSGFNGWNYLRDVATNKEFHFYCDQSFFHQELLKELNRRFQLEEKSRAIVAGVDRMLHPLCWNKTAAALKTRLLEKDDPKNGAIEDLLFKVLNAKKTLSEEEKDFYFTLFILNGPLVGKTFNLAWNRMKLLGENFSRRQKVLQRLIKLDPLPDGVVTTMDLVKRETLLNFVSLHFPEYFDHYGKTCLNYLQGKGHFPRGNPTVNCREFFRITHAQKMVSDQLYWRYSALKVQERPNKKPATNRP